MDNKKIKFPDEKELETVAHQILDNLEVGMTLKDATGISDEALEEVYSLAHSYYNQGKYFEARCLFHFLAGASASTYKYILGLAASAHQLKAYEDASVAFYIALTLEPENTVPAYYLLDSLLKQEHFAEAEEVANYLLDLCEDRSQSELRERVILIKNRLKNREKN